MRISILKSDRAYEATVGKRFESVTVDGRSVMACTADEEEGFALVICADERGKPQSINGEIVTKVMRGKVVIVPFKTERDWDKNKVMATKVQVGRDINGDLIVQVFSAVRPGAIRQARMELAHQPSTQVACAQRMGMMAGMAAEHLCMTFGDTVNPDECARVAIEQALELFRGEI